MARSHPVRLRSRSKYGSTFTTVDGIKFRSAREAKRYGELKLLQKAGEIAGLELQPRFVLSAPCEHPGADFFDPPVILGAYVADFKYRNVMGTGGHVVEDVKGFATPLYKWKKRHVMAQYGIDIKEV